MPYITEELYGAIGRETGLYDGLIMKSAWPKGFIFDFSADDERQINALVSTVTQVRTIKADLGLGAKKIELDISFKAEINDLWHNNKDWVARLAGLEKISIKKHLKRSLYKGEWWDFDFAVSDLDSAAFLASLEKKVLNIENFAAKLAAKLNNENFVKNAPEEIVATDRERFVAAQAELKRLKELRDAFR